MISLPQIIILALIQGACELLPVSSSAHVIVAEKLMGLDPTSASMTLLLVLLHTGTMLAVIVFFWKSWEANFFSSSQAFKDSLKLITVATIATAIVGLFLKIIIEKIILKGTAHAEVELIFGNLTLIAISLACVGVLILWSGYHQLHFKNNTVPMNQKAAFLMGIVQGLCLPFRGFSRSGATISTGLLLGLERRKVEDFSFVLAVVLTPPVVIKETLRLLKFQQTLHGTSALSLLAPSLLGMVLSFISGLLALRWLSNWLARGRWYWFGVYCLSAAVLIFFLHVCGF